MCTINVQEIPKYDCGISVSTSSSLTSCSSPQDTKFRAESFACCINTPNGIVLASDSREKIIHTYSDYRHITKYNDDFQKIVHLPASNIILANCGQSRFGGVEFSKAMLQLDSKLSKLKNVNEIVNELNRFITNSHCQNVGLIMAIKSKQDDKALIVKNLTWDKPANTYSFTEKDTPINLMSWSAPLTEDLVRTFYWQDSLTYKSNYLFDISFMRLSDAVDFARHLVQLHIDYAKYRIDQKPIVGGAVQIATMDLNGKVTIV
jgi:hypothetical protein